MQMSFWQKIKVPLMIIALLLVLVLVATVLLKTGWLSVGNCGVPCSEGLVCPEEVYSCTKKVSQIYLYLFPFLFVGLLGYIAMKLLKEEKSSE